MRMTKEAKVSNMNKCYQKDGNMVTRKIAGQLILVPVRSHVGDLSYIYNMNKVGSRIWELLDGQRSAEDIARTIVEEYEVDLERALKDTLVFLEQMAEQSLITPVREKV